MPWKTMLWDTCRAVPLAPARRREDVAVAFKLQELRRSYFDCKRAERTRCVGGKEPAKVGRKGPAVVAHSAATVVPPPRPIRNIDGHQRGLRHEPCQILDICQRVGTCVAP